MSQTPSDTLLLPHMSENRLLALFALRQYYYVAWLLVGVVCCCCGISFWIAICFLSVLVCAFLNAICFLRVFNSFVAVGSQISQSLSMGGKSQWRGAVISDVLLPVL